MYLAYTSSIAQDEFISLVHSELGSGVMWLYILVGVASYLLYVWWTIRPPNFPPGPPCLPIIGSVPFIQMKGVHWYMEKVRAKYGPVIGLKLATRNAVFICGPKQVMETFKMDVFQGRPRQVAIASHKASKGIILTHGPFWQTQRRFTLRHLRDFGFGKTSIEGAIMEEIQDFFQTVLYQTDRAQITNLFNTSTINVLWRIMSGKRHQNNDEKFKVLLNALHETFKQGGFTSPWPFLRRFFRTTLGFPEKIVCEETLINYVQEAIDEHKKTRTDEARDFLDVYLREIEKGENPDFNELTLISICLDLFTAGAESTGNTLTFCIMYLILYPDIQQNVWEEINQVLGDRDPVLSDRASLPKVEAFLSEVARFNTIAPIPVPRTTLDDVVYEGYNIPKDTFIVISVWAMLRDKDHWGDPDVFRPARFLTEDGKYKKDDWLINFGVGKRQCLGESLAKNVMFLFLVKLVQEFEFSIPAGCPKPSDIGLPGFTVSAQPFEASIKIRAKK